MKFYCLVGFPQFAFFATSLLFFTPTSFSDGILINISIINQSGATVVSGMAIKTVCLLLKMEDLYFLSKAQASASGIFV